MRKSKREKLERAGWKVGGAADFLKLSKEEEELLNIRLLLAAYLRRCRTEQKITQIQLAKSLGSSQSRVAKMEAGDPGVTLDLLIKSLLILGISAKDLGKVIALESV